MYSRINLAISAVLGVVFVLLAWFRSDRTSQGPAPRSLGGRIVLTLVYGVAFVAGEAYLIALFTDLRLPKILLFLAEASWGVFARRGSMVPASAESRYIGATERVTKRSKSFAEILGRHSGFASAANWR